MKRFGFTIKTEKMDEQEIVKEKETEMEMDDKTYEEIMETAESLATLIDYKMMDAAFDLGIREEYTNVLDEIWCHRENMNDETAISVLYAMAMILDRDSMILLRNLIMPSEIATDLFLEFFCEYLADARIFEQTIRFDELRKMREQMECKYNDEDNEDDESEELHDIHYEEVKSFFKKVGDKDE